TQQAERPEQSSLTGAAEGGQRVPAKQKHDTAHEAAGGSQGYDDEESRTGRLPNQLHGVSQQPWKPAKIFFGAALLPAVYPLPLHLRWKVRHHRRRSGSMKSISRRLAPHAVACQLCSGNSVTSAPQWWHHSASSEKLSEFEHSRFRSGRIRNSAASILIDVRAAHLIFVGIY